MQKMFVVKITLLTFLLVFIDGVVLAIPVVNPYSPNNIKAVFKNKLHKTSRPITVGDNKHLATLQGQDVENLLKNEDGFKDNKLFAKDSSKNQRKEGASQTNGIINTADTNRNVGSQPIRKKRKAGNVYNINPQYGHQININNNYLFNLNLTPGSGTQTHQINTHDGVKLVNAADCGCTSVSVTVETIITTIS